LEYAKYQSFSDDQTLNLHRNRNAELTNVQIKDVDLTNCTIRSEQGKGKKDRYVLFPMSFRGELAQYIEKQKRCSAKFLFKSNRLGAFSTRRIHIKNIPINQGSRMPLYRRVVIIIHTSLRAILARTIDVNY